MSSSLRFSSSPATTAPYTITRTTSSSPPPQKKQKMSLTQTYYLAHTARAKLSKEAGKADHELSRLVGHANLLDNLMLDLAEAEREQESWFNQSVRKATKAAQEPKHIQWADSTPTIVEDFEEEEDSSDDESDADDEQEIGYITSSSSTTPLRRVPSPPMTITTREMDIDSDEEEDEDEDDEELALTRTSSRTPPELMHESDSESDDDSMPPSPPVAEIPLDAFPHTQQQEEEVALFPSKKPQSQIQSSSIALPAPQEDAFYEEGFYLPQRQAVSVF